MFEKEAEEHTKKNFCGCCPLTWKNQCKNFVNCGYHDSWKDGAEFGYNKANEWHYVKDGLSEKEKYVLIYTDLKNVYIARLVEDDYFITNKGGFVQTSAVIAWKEIILPKESE